MDSERLLDDINELNHLFRDSASVETLLNKAVEMVAERTQSAVCSIYLYNPEKQELTLRATRGLNPESVGRVRSEARAGADRTGSEGDADRSARPTPAGTPTTSSSPASSRNSTMRFWPCRSPGASRKWAFWSSSGMRTTASASPISPPWRPSPRSLATSSKTPSSSWGSTSRPRRATEIPAGGAQVHQGQDGRRGLRLCPRHGLRQAEEPDFSSKPRLRQDLHPGGFPPGGSPHREPTGRACRRRWSTSSRTPRR